ncbi:MAG: hypothetical protein ACTSSP_01030 [Candidatus Asgardarchaeia archaeon]
MACCYVDGALDFGLVDAHSQYVDLGSNGGVRCDTIDGPCACGAWHVAKEKRKIVKKEIIESRFDILDL